MQYLVSQIALCMTHGERGYMKVSKYQICFCILSKGKQKVLERSNFCNVTFNVALFACISVEA